MKHAFVNSFCHHLHKPRNDPSVQLPIPYSFRSRLEKSDLNSPRSPNHHSAFIIHLFPLFVPQNRIPSTLLLVVHIKAAITGTHGAAIDTRPIFIPREMRKK
jgi:hypothetical protein